MQQHWYVYKHGQRHGPFAAADLRAWIHDGDLATDDLVWRQGMDRWLPAGQLPVLREAPMEDLIYHPEQAPVGAPPTQAVPRRDARFRFGVLGFMLLAAALLIAVAVLFDAPTREAALVVWVWMAIGLMGVAAYGVPLGLLIAGRP